MVALGYLKRFDRLYIISIYIKRRVFIPITQRAIRYIYIKHYLSHGEFIHLRGKVADLRAGGIIFVIKVRLVSCYARFLWR